MKKKGSEKLILLLGAFTLSALLLLGCSCEKARVEGPENGAFPDPAGAAPGIRANAIDRYLAADFAPSDGFDFPVGDPDGKGSYADKATGRRYDGWKISTRFAEEYSLGLHPGEDWNGAVGGATDLGQDVFAVANGRVRFAENCGRLWGNVVIIEHIFYENSERRMIRSVYAHLLEIRVKKGDDVRRRQAIGAVGQDPEKTYPPHLHLELRRDAGLPPTYCPSSDGKDAAWLREHYAAPSEFIGARRQLFVPQRERTLVLVDQAGYKMRLYKDGKMRGEYEVGFGQGKGAKRVRGDNKTPAGMYFVIQKHRGRFEGEYGAYYGGHWIKVNYPNRYDAERGLSEGIVSRAEAEAIRARWAKRQATLENTRLGAGIGFHGWVSEWDDAGPRHLSGGCVVMHIYDIRRLFDEIPPGAMAVIF